MLYEDIEKEKASITLNILPNILQHYPIDRLILFATNQGHHQDTYYVAKIIQYYYQSQIPQIEIYEIKGNPTQRDYAFQFYRDFFDNHPELKDTNLLVS